MSTTMFKLTEINRISQWKINVGRCRPVSCAAEDSARCAVKGRNTRFLPFTRKSVLFCGKPVPRCFLPVRLFRGALPVAARRALRITEEPLIICTIRVTGSASLWLRRMPIRLRPSQALPV